MYKYGIDVSYANGVLDWEKLKDQIDFAIIRAGWIGNGKMEMDSQFERNYSECKRLGIPVGAYIYSYAESIDAINEGCDYMLSHMEEKEFELPLFLDLEDKQIAYIPADEMTTLALEFCNYIEINSDCKAGVYANLDWFENHLEKEKLFSYEVPCWIAHWGVAPERYAESNYMMCQYDVSDCLDIGDVDLDILYEDKIEPSGDDSVEPAEDDIDIPYRYQNGSTRETVYCDSECTREIGSLNPYENVACLGTIDSKAVVVYTVDGGTNQKIGFVRWLGGIV